MIYDPYILANFFIEKGISTKTFMSPHKVEFLIYFAHGWHLAIDGRPFIDEKVKAWRHGPVIESIHKRYVKMKSGVHGCFDDQACAKVRGLDVNFLEGIWNYYSHLNEVEMLNLCTKRGTPWELVYERSSSEIVIEDSKIKQYYKMLHITHPEFCDLDDPISLIV